jgi:beta-phosphoglucomutase family hydrolase
MKAVIFDMDGVISDTQNFHADTESELLRQYGIEMSSTEITKRYAGVPYVVMFAEIFSDHSKAMPGLDIIKHKWDIIRRADARNIHAVPGASELITALHEQRVPLAVASASRAEFIQRVVAALELERYFTALVSADEVPRGKPAPDVFLLAAQRLGILPGECVVIEDGLSGMIGAKAAGMKCVALLTHVRAEDSPADVKIYSLGDVSAKMLIDL